MKLFIPKNQFDELPILNQLFLALWKEEKKYTGDSFSYGELTELALVLTNDLHFEISAERTTFNNLLEYDEMLVGWDGEEPIEILWYELNKKLQKRINGYLVVNNKPE